MKHIKLFENWVDNHSLDEAKFGKFDGSTADLDASALLDILKGDVRTKISKDEIIWLLSNPSELATVVHYITADQKEGFLNIKLIKRLARREIESNELMRNTFDTLLSIYIEKFGEFDETDDEFKKWLSEINDITSAAAQREILIDSIGETEKKIEALQSSLEQMKAQLEDLKNKK